MLVLYFLETSPFLICLCPAQPKNPQTPKRQIFNPTGQVMSPKPEAQQRRHPRNLSARPLRSGFGEKNITLSAHEMQDQQ